MSPNPLNLIAPDTGILDVGWGLGASLANTRQS